jgi:hypothetical protein
MLACRVGKFFPEVKKHGKIGVGKNEPKWEAILWIFQRF